MAEAENTPEAGTNGKAARASTPWIPLVLVLMFIPIITLALVEFVVVPKLRKGLSHGSETASTHTMEASVEKEAGGHGATEGDSQKGGSIRGTTVTFEDVITNVAGTMGTRFLKISFQIVSQDAQLAGIVRMRDAQVKDAIISTLSSRTIQEIEAAGGRNALRIALISAINGAIGLNLVEELYFLDFIIQ